MKKVLLIFLSASLLGVLFLLPKLEIQTFISSPDYVLTTVNQSSEISQSKIAESKKYRKEAQDLLEQIIEKRDLLEAKAINKWGFPKFSVALESISTGDTLYREGDYKNSIQKYFQALKTLENLESESIQIIQNLVFEAKNSIENLKPNSLINDIIDSINLGYAIDSKNKEIKLLKQRSNSLPELFSVIMESEILISRGSLNEAKELLVKALEIDPLREKTKNRLKEVNTQIKDRDFAKFMSKGFRAMDRKEFTNAREVFTKASKTYPNRADVSKALIQLEAQEAAYQISRKIENAKANEEKENWQEAKRLYESVIKEDDTLVNAKVRMINVRVRAKLDQDLNNLIADPLALLSESNYLAAKILIETAKNIRNPGPKLTEQVNLVSAIILNARRPIDVEFISDNNTNVTVFKIEKLGVFLQRTLKLIPGEYVALGQRTGYRDKRVAFTVMPNTTDMSISIMCTESI